MGVTLQLLCAWQATPANTAPERGVAWRRTDRCPTPTRPPSLRASIRVVMMGLRAYALQAVCVDSSWLRQSAVLLSRPPAVGPLERNFTVSIWREKLSGLIAVPKSFDLLTHETETGFQIVEPKDIPSQIPLVSSPLHMFFHEALVNHLLKCGAGIEKVQHAHIFRKSNGFTSDHYFTLTVRDQWSFTAMMGDDFRPAQFNAVEGISGSVFFSRDYYNQVSNETDLVFEELPVIFLIPLGEGE